MATDRMQLFFVELRLDGRRRTLELLQRRGDHVHGAPQLSPDLDRLQRRHCAQRAQRKTRDRR